MNSKFISAAQIILSVLYVAGYFWLLNKFLDGEIKTPVEWRDQLSVLMGVLTTGVAMVLQFWFARSREKDQSE